MLFQMYINIYGKKNNGMSDELNRSDLHAHMTYFNSVKLSSQLGFGLEPGTVM